MGKPKDSSRRRETVAEAIRLDEQGQSMAALKLLDYAIASDPGDYWLEGNRAAIAARVLIPSEKIVAAQRYCERFSNRAHPHLLMAEVLHTQGRAQEALTHIEEAERIGGQPKDATVSAKARILLDLGRPEEAETLADPSVGPKSAILWLELHPPLSDIEMQLAIKKLEAAGVRTLQVASLVADWHQKYGRSELSIAYLERAVTEEPENLDLQTLLAQVEASAGKEQAAFERVKRILDADPGNAALARWYVQHLRQRRRYLRALAFSIRFLKAQTSIKP